jgi:hypothetical protein
VAARLKRCKISPPYLVTLLVLVSALSTAAFFFFLPSALGSPDLNPK